MEKGILKSTSFKGLLIFSLLLMAAVAAFFYFSGRPVPSLHVLPYVRHQEPSFLSFEELKKFAQNPHPGVLLEKKLERFWKTPILNNEVYYEGVKPYRPEDPELGDSLRLVSWNIEKSFHIEDAVKVLTPSPEFESLINTEDAAPGSEDYQTILRQRERLLKADILVLQEMDIGVKRSGYINAAEELAKKLKMNYTYAAEQLEIDPVYLGLEKIQYKDGTVDQEQTDYYAADPKKYKGVFGVAVLSRYPIKKVTVFQLKSQAYDWYEGEKPKIGFVEETRRQGTKILFQNQLTREMKIGGRNYFRVDLDVPGLPNNTLSIINIHLEIKCLPKGREAQMAEILSYIKGIKNPVIMVGDYNSAPHDMSPTSAWRVVKRAAKSPETWVAVGTSVLLPHALIINASRVTAKYTKNFQDPLAADVAVLSPNPLKTLFESIRDFRFNDGSAFDFRGDEERSINGKDGSLANSNQRGMKGFKTTWSVKRPITVIGKYRLDWVFVKSGHLTDPYNKEEPYQFAPHRGETLEEMNTSLTVPISDHHPSIVDLPFGEPVLKKAA